MFSGTTDLILPMLTAALPDAAGHIRYDQLGIGPVALDLGFFTLKWYSLAYIGGILIGWWYLLKLIDQPGAPMARRHADDLVFYATLGIILGGRIGYIIFYAPDMILKPLSMLRLWDGGMSFHGGLAGLSLAIWYVCRANRLQVLRVLDYVGCVASIGQFLGRLANFVNGELWGKPTDVAWAVIFPTGGGDVPRHPSQLYEAFGEGLIPFLIMAYLFWCTDARYKPGFLTGFGLAFFGAARFLIEFYREPDRQFEGTFFANVLHMGQVLCLPMILLGVYLMWTAKGRRQRVEPVAGGPSIA